MKNVMYLLLLSLFIVGCTPKVDNEIDKTVVEETDRIEDATLEAAVHNYEGLEAYDIISEVIYYQYTNLPSEYKGLNLWIEYYRDGKLHNNPLIGLDSGGGNVSIQRSGSIICYFDRVNAKETKIVLNGGSVLEQINFDDLRIHTIVSNNTIEVNDDEFTLGIVIADSGSIIEEEEKIQIEDVMHYKHVYVVKGRFHH